MNEELKCLLKFKKKTSGGVGVGFVAGFGLVGIRVDVNEELKLLWKCKINRGGGGGGSRVGDGRKGGGCLVAMLGVGGDVGYGGCEPRIEGIVQCTKGIVQY